MLGAESGRVEVPGGQEDEMSDEKQIDEDDVEGSQRGRKVSVANEEVADDTEGQGRRVANEESDLEDDTEGHNAVNRRN